MENYTPDDIRARKVEAANQLHDYIRTIVPLYHEQLSKGFKINQTGDFSKKDVDVLLTIRRTILCPQKIRHYFKISKYSIYIMFDTHYQISDHVCKYYECSVYIYNYKTPVSVDDKAYWEMITFHPDVYRTDFTNKEVLGTEIAIKIFEEEKNDLEEKINSIKHEYRPFFQK